MERFVVASVLVLDKFFIFILKFCKEFLIKILKESVRGDGGMSVNFFISQGKRAFFFFKFSV